MLVEKTVQAVSAGELDSQICFCLSLRVTVKVCPSLRPGREDRLTQQGFKKSKHRQNERWLQTQVHHDIKHPDLTRSSLSLSHEPPWKLSGLVNGETPTASLSAGPTARLSAGLGRLKPPSDRLSPAHSSSAPPRTSRPRAVRAAG